MVFVQRPAPTPSSPGSTARCSLSMAKNLVCPAPVEMALAQTRTPPLDVLRFKNHIRPAPPWRNLSESDVDVRTLEIL